MKGYKKVFKCVVKICLLLSLLSVTGFCGNSSVKVSAATQNDAVNWAVSQIGKGLDYDGAYGNQCVDLIKYYYAYFGVAGYASGNANAYKSNNLPPGWTRVYGNYQPGDVAVWKTNHSCSTCSTTSYGHVGIITSADSAGFNAVNQNFNGNSYCTQNWFNISALACAIRPAFVTDTTPPVIDNVRFDDVIINNISEKSATFSTWISNEGTIDELGFYIGQSDVYQNKVVVNTNITWTRFCIDWDISKLYTELNPGQSYTYVLYAKNGGKEYRSYAGHFTTQGSKKISFDTYSIENISGRSASISVWFSNDNGFKLDSIGFCIGNGYKNMEKIEVVSDVYWTRACLNYELGKYWSLKSKTAYYTKFYVEINGEIIYSDYLNFETTNEIIDDIPTKAPTEIPTKAPTQIPAPISTVKPTIKPVVESTKEPVINSTFTVAEKTQNYKNITEDNISQDTYQKEVTTPKMTTIKSYKKEKGGQVLIKWHKIASANGYQIQYSAKKNFIKKKTRTVYGNNKVKLKLKANRRYYVRVRAFKYGNIQSKVYGKWSSRMKIKLHAK